MKKDKNQKNNVILSETKNLMRSFTFVQDDNQRGRSMVEMLGVLAVIGVLSVAGIAGYNNAMNKHRANELINEASKRATVVAMQDAAGQNLNLGEFSGQPNADLFTPVVENPNNNNQFQLTISSVDEDICKQMVNAVGTGSQIRKITSAGTDVTGNATNCSDGAIVLTFNKDLSSTVWASDFNGDQSACEADNTRQYCAGNDTCIAKTDTCPPTDPTCSINPETDCLTKALVEGECACAPVADETVECTSWTTNECGKGKYCQFTYSGSENAYTGVCNDISACGEKGTYDDFWMSDYDPDICLPNWLTAQSICTSMGKHLVNLSDIGCEDNESTCSSDTLSEIRNAGLTYGFWTGDVISGSPGPTNEWNAWYIEEDNSLSSRGESDDYDILCVD